MKWDRVHPVRLQPNQARTLDDDYLQREEYCLSHFTIPATSQWPAHLPPIGAGMPDEMLDPISLAIRKRKRKKAKAAAAQKAWAANNRPLPAAERRRVYLEETGRI